jgi:predicted metal-dependent hydrolase
VPDRDRNADGAPENARPRDRTGRPLPYGTTRTDLAEEWEVGTVEEALAAGQWLWDQQRYFEAHECLEHVWHHAPAEDRTFWQGVIQVAVACVHHQRGNARGVAATCRKALANLDGHPSVHHGIDVDQLRTFCEGVADVMDRAGTCVEIGYPELPTMDDGPWFTEQAGSTPLSREPAWRTAARDRRREARSDA